MGKMTKADIEKMNPEAAAVQILIEKFVSDEAEKRNKDRFKNIEAELEWKGTTLTLPAEPTKMMIEEAQEWLARFQQAQQEEIHVLEEVDAFPFDGAIALMKALKQVYGWASPVPPQHWMEAPPTMISVDISPTERTQIIWGRFQIPGIDGTLMTGAAMKAGRPVFAIRGKIRKKHAQAVAEIAELTRQIVKAESIYRGKAVRLAVDGDGDLNLNEAPTFLDLAQTNPDELIFSEELQDQVETNLWAPLRYTAVCKQNKIPLKRTVLMEGPFGTGKTLAASVTAQIAVQSDWTFIMVERVTALAAALSFAVMYQPCVIFCEDIDRETSGERTPQLDDILNVIDGIVSKGKGIMVVLTSNNAEAIHRAMMRPGRIDAVLSIQAPDAAAAERLMRLYARNLIPSDEKLPLASAEMDGQIPAVIRECVERAKLYAIARNHQGKIELHDRDLMRAAQGMKRHLQLLAGTPPATVTDEHKLGAAVSSVLAKTMGQTNGKTLYAVTTEVLERVNDMGG